MPGHAPDRFDVAELFTVAVRQVLPIAAAKQMSFAFDCRGPQLVVAGDAVALQCGLHRVLCAALDVIEAGFAIFDAELTPTPDRRCRVVVQAAGTGALASDAMIDTVLERMRMRERSSAAPPGTPRLRRAHDVCPRTGASVEFTSMPSQGMLWQWSHVFDLVEPPADDAVIDADAARAWVIDCDSSAAESLVHRLQRLGWATSKLHSVQQAERRLAEMQGRHARPALVLAIESDAVALDDVRRLAATMPPRSSCVFGVLAGSTALSGRAAAVIDIGVIPFSPADLRRLTFEAAGGADRPSGATRPAPLMLRDRPPVLVVDDDEVNRIVASGLAQSLGYRVTMACDGIEALAACRSSPPAVVLMDLTMPRLNGVEATLLLRDMQRSGDVPPFAIVAVTADASTQTRQRCVEAGMDGYLTKPLLRSALQDELRRVRTGVELTF